MKPISKQSEALATNSKLSDFRRAVIRLTLYYSAGVFFILMVFSALVYGLFVQSITIDQSEDHDDIERETVIHDELKENLFDIIILSDLLLLILTIIVSYFLSKKTLAPLEASYYRQKRFVADVAHELRTPLAVMKAGSEVLLQKERGPEAYKIYIKDVLGEIQRLITLSNELLFLVQQGRVTPSHFQKVSLSEICKKQCDLIGAYAQTKNVSIISHVQDGVEIEGNSESITRMLLNLLKNAIDYNVQNGKVEVTLDSDHTKVKLIIKDTGIGIDARDIPHIFDRFYKADVARTQRESTGSGLGLAIVHEIVTEHKGTITVSSSPNEGTTFELSFIKHS
ncbi:MAG: hypothetical protein RLY57_125 [Candidatus Parcubacteria bacterium]|jgi:signal transduction histidine kinase